MFFVDKETSSERMGICERCKFYQTKTKTCGTPIKGDWVKYRKKEYKLCGCIMPVKTRLKAMSCPVGKWKPAIPKEDIQRIREITSQANNQSWTHELNAEMTKYHNQLTGANDRPTTCKPCMRSMVTRLKTFLADANQEN